MTRNTQDGIGTLIHAFFCDRLIAQRNASPRTVSSYRDTVRLLLQYASTQVKKPPTQITLNDLDAPLILEFLDDLENGRGNSKRTRNNRLAAVKSFVKYVALQEPTYLPNAQRILAIPMKRFDRPALVYLSRAEVEAISEAPDTKTWSGHRDHVLFVMFYNTGARVSELVGLKVGDVSIDKGGFVRLHGKGRKERIVPLWKTTLKTVRKWLCFVDSESASPLFPNRGGQPLTRSGVEYRLRVAVKKAGSCCPSLNQKTVSPHTFRHTTAMHLLQAGVDIATIALWLGHESPSTTHTYIEADLAMKESALNRLQEPKYREGRYKASDAVLSFLNSL